MGGDQQRVDRSVCDQNDGLCGVGLERPLHRRYKSLARLVCTLAPKNPFIRFSKKCVCNSLKISRVVEIRHAGTVVLVQIGCGVTRQAESFSHNFTRLSGFRLVTGNDDTRTVGAELFNQTPTLPPPFVTEKPAFSGHVRLNVGMCVLDERKTARSFTYLCPTEHAQGRRCR